MRIAEKPVFLVLKTINQSTDSTINSIFKGQDW